jgi:hypothetical protein
VGVERDVEDTQGYFVLQSWDGPTGPGRLGVFDDWVETREELEEYFRGAGWQVRWSP